MLCGHGKHDLKPTRGRLSLFFKRKKKKKGLWIVLLMKCISVKMYMDCKIQLFSNTKSSKEDVY